MLVASWNIEKNGQSSVDIKQTLVSGFIDHCLGTLEVDVLFLCEVHSARVADYVNYVASVYQKYKVFSAHGGRSNCYIVVHKNTGNISVLGGDNLRGLNRPIVIVEAKSHHFNFNGYLGLAHFKSGRTALTKAQIREAVDFISSASRQKYFITGDINWDYSAFAELDVPALAAKQWDVTQKKGGCLDWALYGVGVDVSPYDFSAVTRSNPELLSMDKPDHKPVIFDVCDSAS
jgi:hypothetical protein